MSDSKFTPGPWGICRTGPVMAGYAQPLGIYQKGHNNLIAGIFGDVKGGEEVAEANACLLGEALDMLESLQDLIAICEPNLWPQPDKPNSPWGKLKKAKEVVARAKGETK